MAFQSLLNQDEQGDRFYFHNLSSSGSDRVIPLLSLSSE
jgi:hypothetical protein